MKRNIHVVQHECSMLKVDVCWLEDFGLKDIPFMACSMNVKMLKVDVLLTWRFWTKGHSGLGHDDVDTSYGQHCMDNGQMLDFGGTLKTKSLCGT